MRRGRALILALLAAFGLTAPAASQGTDQAAGRLSARAAAISIAANPSALIAAEIALGKLASEKGEAHALLATAAPGARLMRPEPVDAVHWIRRNRQAMAPTRWNAQSVWMSCDGAIGVVNGTWVREEQAGHFASVWQRQAKGDYRWLLRLDTPGRSKADRFDDMLAAMVADCPPRSPRGAAAIDSNSQRQSGRASAASPQLDALSGQSPDGSLRWRIGSDMAGARRLLVQLAKGGEMVTVLGAELEESPAG
ncbi:MAG: hypothetical protein N2423_05315 [Novosphingobium sp.]|nr:hypothetical protein [Novosphingobium sp.]